MKRLKIFRYNFSEILFPHIYFFLPFKEVKSIQNVKSMSNVKSIQEVKSLEEVKNIYALTKKQAQMLRYWMKEGL